MRLSTLMIISLGLALLGAGIVTAQDAPKAAPAADATAGAGSGRLDDTKSFASGEEAFDKVCGRCHVTGVGPDLFAGEYDIDSLRHFVRNGYLAMPAFPESALDDKTLEDIAAHIAETAKKGGAK